MTKHPAEDRGDSVLDRFHPAVAAWFRQHGISIPIAFAGFGETVPAVKTADNVDEPRNRRVDYVLSDGPPQYSGGLSPAWKQIK